MFISDAVLIQLIISAASIITTVVLQRRTVQKESVKVQNKVEEQGAKVTEQGTKLDEHGKKIDDMITKYSKAKEFKLPALDISINRTIHKEL